MMTAVDDLTTTAEGRAAVHRTPVNRLVRGRLPPLAALPRVDSPRPARHSPGDSAHTHSTLERSNTRYRDGGDHTRANGVTRRGGVLGMRREVLLIPDSGSAQPDAA